MEVESMGGTEELPDSPSGRLALGSARHPTAGFGRMGLCHVLVGPCPQIQSQSPPVPSPESLTDTCPSCSATLHRPVRACQGRASPTWKVTPGDYTTGAHTSPRRMQSPGFLITAHRAAVPMPARRDGVTRTSPLPASPAPKTWLPPRMAEKGGPQLTLKEHTDRSSLWRVEPAAMRELKCADYHVRFRSLR